jgi:hypothetical protein
MNSIRSEFRLSDPPNSISARSFFAKLFLVLMGLYVAFYLFSATAGHGSFGKSPFPSRVVDMVARNMLCAKARTLANFDVRSVAGFGQDLDDDKALVFIGEVDGGTGYWVASEGRDGRADCVDWSYWLASQMRSESQMSLPGQID